MSWLVAPFTGIVTLEEDHILETEFKFNFELVGFGVTLRKTSRNIRSTFKSVFMELRGEILDWR